MNLVRFFLTFLPSKTAYAHCDIPCGIYDPHNMQMAAHTIIRMTQLINDLKPSSKEPPFDERKRIISQISRLTHVKEEHSDLLEEELETLRNDYFKEEHYKEYPNLEYLFVKTLKAGAKARVEIDMTSAEEALAGTQEIAEIFFRTKGVTPVRVKSVYPTEREIVTHQ